MNTTPRSLGRGRHKPGTGHYARLALALSILRLRAQSPSAHRLAALGLTAQRGQARARFHAVYGQNWSPHHTPPSHLDFLTSRMQNLAKPAEVGQGGSPQRARSSRYPGRYHVGNPGKIMSVCLGGFVGICTLKPFATSLMPKGLPAMPSPLAAPACRPLR